MLDQSLTIVFVLYCEAGCVCDVSNNMRLINVSPELDNISVLYFEISCVGGEL